MGIIIGAAVFVSIGICHPLVIKMEYHWGKQSWWIWLVAGLAIMAIGMWIYMSAEQCCGPRDSLLVGLGKRLPKIPIGIVGALLWATVLLIGWLLGGPVGIGTLISAFGGGVIMQVIYNLLHFEPRRLMHKDVPETLRMIKAKT